MKNKKNIFVLLSIFLLTAMFIITFVLMLNILITGSDPLKRFSSHLATMSLTLIAIIIIFIFKTKINVFLYSFFTVYIFLAVFLGSSLNFYNTYENLNYDKLIHVYFGYASALIGLYLFIKFKQFEQSTLLYMIVFVFSFSMMVAGVWELFEFSSDQLFHTVTQGKPLESIYGTFLVDVGETMFDMISNLIGTIILIIPLVLERKYKNTLITKSIINALLY